MGDVRQKLMPRELKNAHANAPSVIYGEHFQLAITDGPRKRKPPIFTGHFEPPKQPKYTMEQQSKKKDSQKQEQKQDKPAETDETDWRDGFLFWDDGDDDDDDGDADPFEDEDFDIEEAAKVHKAKVMAIRAERGE